MPDRSGRLLLNASAPEGFSVARLTTHALSGVPRTTEGLAPVFVGVLIGATCTPALDPDN